MVTNTKSTNHPSKVERPLGSVYIVPYVNGVSEKFKCIGNHYNIRVIFKTRHILRSSVMKTWPKRDLQQRTQRVYNTPCKCGRSYIDGTGM